MTTVPLGLALGLDNAAVALALGMLNLGTRRMLLLGLWFGAAEMLMTLAGAALGPAPASGMVAYAGGAKVGVLLALAAVVLVFALMRHDPGAFVGKPPAAFGVALLLGLDNLAAGADLMTNATPFAAIAAAGMLSAAVAFAACAAGGLLGRLLEPALRPIATAAILAAAAIAGTA
jgi:putative Mn2+ efflux pump MntP